MRVKGMKRFLLLSFVLMLCVPLALATQVQVNPLNDTSNRIFFDETAQYTLTITNDGNADKVYSWSINPLEWVIESSTSGRVPASTTRQFPLSLRPRPSSFRGPGIYVLPVTVETATETLQDQLTVNIKSVEDRLLDYNPSVALGASLDAEVDPRNKLSSQIQIRNRNIRMIDNITLELSSENFYQTESFALSSLEEKTLEYRFELDPLTSPGTYNFEANLVFEGETISQVKKYYDVVAYSVIDRDTSVNKKLFQRIQITQLQNNGNIEKTVSTNLNMPFLKRMFTSVDIEANNIESVNTRSWVITLQPKEQATVYVKQNYTALVVLLVLIALAIVAYFLMRSPITLQKQIIVTGKDEQGISEMKVRIYLRNRTEQAFYNLRLLDKAPTIAQVVESDGLGVLEPTKIVRSEKKGTIIKWDFDSLEAYEERIVTYTIKSKLKIIGNLNLPAVKVKYETAKGNEKTAESSIAQIGKKN